MTGAGGTKGTGSDDASPADRLRSLLHGSLLGVGALLGALAVVGGVGLAGDPPLTDTVPLWKGLVWYFFDVQFVPIVEARGARAGRFAVVEAVDSPLTPLAYVAPPTALVLAGWLAVRRGILDALDAPAPAAGAAISLGYLLPTVVLGVASGHTVALDLVVTDLVREITPQIGARFVLVAVGYPVAFGGLGGALAAWRAGE